MNYLCFPVTYTVHGKDCSIYSFAKKNKTTATYEVRISPEFAFRTYLPLKQVTLLTPDGSIPKEISLLACLPENLALCQAASFETFPAAE